MDSTIASISTSSGNGAIGIVRLSGPKTFEIIKKIFVPKGGENKIKGYTLKYGDIVEPESKEIVDEVLVSFFVHPKSYTKEDMCEINTHGGMVVERKILNICLANGAELATPGEFTKRAFLNGRIDLTQAEAIIDLINSKSDKEAKESINQLSGSLSTKINEIENKLLKIMINIEVVVDYPEYDTPEITNSDALNELDKINVLLNELEKSFEQGKILRDGVRTVIFGKPNAGKSSLLNKMLNEDRAIVSNIEGTTRDSIEEYINVDGISLKLIDTAGIRDTDNEIEKIGVEKSKRLAKEADLIIAIFDVSKELEAEDYEILDIIKDKKAIVVLNKVDINTNENTENILNKLCKPIAKISALNGTGIDNLYKKIVEICGLESISSSNEIIITNERHKNQIKKAIENVNNAILAIKENTPVDISSIYIKQALEDLGEITGKNVNEDIINEIFKNFCLGK